MKKTKTVKHEVRVCRIFRIDGGNQLVGFADVAIDNCLVIRGFKILKNGSTLKVYNPSEMGKDDKWYSTIHFLIEEVQKEVYEKIIEGYLSK